jgi:centromere/kinetochore protein ZW10
MHQDDKKACVEAAVSRIRGMAITWDAILARAAWYQAVGTLVDAVSAKIIADVLDLAAISQDEAYSIADLIASATELDDLFLPQGTSKATKSHTFAHGNEPEEPKELANTPKYAPSWMRLKYLSEVLQSNLRDVRYLWMDMGLSFCFSADEVVDLIKLSFEDNARTREVIKEITENPYPRAHEED